MHFRAGVTLGPLVLLIATSCAGPQTLRPKQPPQQVHGGDITPVAKRAEELPALFSAQPPALEPLFTEHFLVQVPASQVRAIGAQLRGELGDGVGITEDPETMSEPYEGAFTLRFSSGATAPVKVVVEPEQPHRISGLWIGPPTRAGDSLESVLEELRGLPGAVSFLIARLGGDEPATIVELNEGLPLAVGSAAKLYILAELIRGVGEGMYRWEEVVPLEADARSLPSGALGAWPAGTPLTLQTLASLMISQSDNTATDQLLRTLGRERVESMLEVTGHHQPALNRPFFSTLELFRLKLDPRREAAQAYFGLLEEEERRGYLATELIAIPREKLLSLTAPTHIETLEWFASASDLCNLMDWLRRNTAEGAGARAREILAINPGLPGAVGGFRYAGFKGGSEPGVMNLSFLLEDDAGSSYALAATWNDPKAALDERKFASIISRALSLLAKGDRGAAD